MKAKNIVMIMVFVLCIGVFSACGKEERNEVGFLIRQEGVPKEVLSSNSVELEADLSRSAEKNVLGPNIPKDYNEKDYMKYDIVSTYFTVRNGYGYEFVISVAGEEEDHKKDVKIFVSKVEGDTFCLKQVLTDEKFDAIFWEGDELYLADVNFDGMEDILIEHQYSAYKGARRYSCFLFNGDTYDFCESFTDIYNACIDPERERLLSTDDASQISLYQIFKFENGIFDCKYSLLVGHTPGEIRYYTEQAFARNTDPDSSSKHETLSFEEYSDEDGEKFINGKLYAEDSLWRMDDPVWYQGIFTLRKEPQSRKKDITLSESDMEEWIADCPKDGNMEAYYTAKVVFLGEYPLSGTIGGVEHESMLLYGYRGDQEENNGLIISLDHALYYVSWDWESPDMTLPRVACKNMDQDEDMEILITGLMEQGSTLHLESLCLLDFQGNSLKTAALTGYEAAQLAEEVVSCKDELARNYLYFYVGDEDRYSFRVPAPHRFDGKPEKYSSSDSVSYMRQVRFNEEKGKLEVRPQAECENALSTVDIVINYRLVYENGELGLKFLSFGQEEMPDPWRLDQRIGVKKDYDAEEYMQYPISTIYFYEENGYAYEFVISIKSQKESNEKDVKIFVSKREGDEYKLQQVIQNEVGDSYGHAMKEDGIYLMDVNFDGMNDILIHDGSYGARGHSYYSCYLYNGEEYELCKSFFDIPNPSIDTERKQILGYLYDNSGWQSFEIYTYQNGAFHKERELSEQTVYEEDAEGNDSVTYEYCESIYELTTNSDGTTQQKLVSEEEFSQEENGAEFVNDKLNGADSYWQFDVRGNLWGKDKIEEAWAQF